jgi:hypothetical protein
MVVVMVRVVDMSAPASALGKLLFERDTSEGQGIDVSVEYKYDEEVHEGQEREGGL